MMYFFTTIRSVRVQWQAQEPPQGVDDAEDALEPLSADEVDAPLSAAAAGAAAAAAAAVAPPVAPVAAPEPPRKSVTYQPEPLSWKPAAVTCLAKLSAPQAGQVVSTGSDIFCSTSFACPQEEQR